MKGNKLKKVTIILDIVLICLVSFIGVYVQVQNRMENKVKDYSFGMNLKGSRVVTLQVSEESETIVKDKDGNVVEDATDEEIETNGYAKEEVPVNKEEILNEENYNNTKKILEERLKKVGVQSYNLRVNIQDGTIVIELPEDDNTDFIVSNITEVGEFKITDSVDTNNVLLNNDDIKTSKVLYESTSSGTLVHFDIEFNKEGTKKLEEITKQYATIEKTATQNTTENSETVNEEKSNEEETQKEIAMMIDGSTLNTSSFKEIISNGVIRMSIGQATTDVSELQSNVQNATAIATLLDTGKLPIKYTMEGNEFIASNITNEELVKIAIVSAVILAIALLGLVLKYKGQGILSAISFAGLIAVYLLIIRYTNVLLTIESICGIILVMILNYILNRNILKGLKESEDKTIAVKDSFIDFILKIVPVCIISIVFCFIQWTALNSFGMTMFWGIATILIYNFIVTKTLLSAKK